APEGVSNATITVSGADASTTVELIADNPVGVSDEASHVEAHGFVSLAASDYSRSVTVNDVSWTLLPDHGRTGDAMTPFPVTAASQDPGDDAPRLEYDMHLFGSGEIRVTTYLSPTQAIQAEALRLALSFDDQAPVIVEADASLSNNTWETSV